LTWHLAALSLVALYAVLALRWLPTRRLESVLGLAGKILGPIGLGQLILSGAWPPRTLVLSITNDFIWWIPFAMYLVESWPYFKREWR
jgi:multisubunit Na+/H+ antiporter MnhB subunit